MALISINGVALPTPSEFSVGIYDISKAERNAKGNLIIERITTKIKLSITYSYLTGPQLKTVLQAIEPTFYNVTYMDPLDNLMKTSSFYCGDRSVGMVDFVGNVPRYKDLGFELIER